MHRHLDTQARSRLQAQEIDMKRLILDGIELVIAGITRCFTPPTSKLEDRRQEMPGVINLFNSR